MSGTRAPSPPTWSILLSVLVIATAGLVYELAIAAAASYLAGDSVRQFSLVIGAYLSALGLGAYASRHVDRRLSAAFVDVELGAAMVGGLSVPALFFAFAHTHAFMLVLYAVVLGVGVLVGLELPLLLRLLERRVEFKELVARALTVDYAGALVGSVAFSLVLVPRIGLFHTSLACGLVNAAVALFAARLFPPADDDEARALRAARVRAVAVVLFFMLALSFGDRVRALAESALYPGDVVLAEDSPYQRIVVVGRPDAFELFLNGNLQFSSRDEYRYHEALVHPAMAVASSRARVVVGGGGDGLAVREILRYPEVRGVTLVDLDRKVTDLARRYGPLVALNRASLEDPRVTVVNEDAMRWFDETDRAADVIVLDFPDPSGYSTAKLFSTAFYERVKRRLAPGGALVIQASSPFLAPRTFGCIAKTVEEAGFAVRPYHVFVPSFGVWGFVLAKRKPFDVPAKLLVEASFMDAEALRDAFAFPADLKRPTVVENRLDTQALVGYYADEWGRWESR